MTAEIIHGDCLEVMRGMADASVDAIVTDPPYGTAVARDGYGRRQLYGGRVGRHIAGDEDLTAMAAALKEARRVLRPDSWAVVFCSPKRHLAAAREVEAAGFTIPGEVVWNKRLPGLGGGIRYQHENILLCANGNPKPSSRGMFSVLSYTALRRRAGQGHPHEKPVELMAALVRYAAPPGGLVLDPFAGSGSTGVAALSEGRRFLGVDLDAAWAAMARTRLSEAQPSLGVA